MSTEPPPELIQNLAKTIADFMIQNLSVADIIKVGQECCKVGSTKDPPVAGAAEMLAKIEEFNRQGILLTSTQTEVPLGWVKYTSILSFIWMLFVLLFFYCYWKFKIGQGNHLPSTHGHGDIIWNVQPTKQVPVKLNVLNPPSRVASSHAQILERVNIQDSDEGPIVVTALIATRADDDIEKAMREVNISGSQCGNTILFRMVPIPSWQADSYGKRKTKQQFLLDLTFLVDQMDLTLLECDHNEKEISELIRILNTN